MWGGGINQVGWQNGKECTQTEDRENGKGFVIP